MTTFFFLYQPLTNVSDIIGLKILFLIIVFYISFSRLPLVWKVFFFVWKSSDNTIDLLPRFLNLRMHWRFSTIFKASNKSLWSVFWYVKYIFWKLIQSTIHWDKTQMLKKFPSDEINDQKNALFFLSLASTHYNFFFNLQFLYELKHMVHNFAWDFPFLTPFRFY